MSDPEDAAPETNHDENGADVESKSDLDLDDVPRLDVDSPQRTPRPVTPSTPDNHRAHLGNPMDNVSDVASVDSSLVDPGPQRVESPVDSVTSGNGASIQVSQAWPSHAPDEILTSKGSFMSSPGSSVLPSMASRPGFISPSPSFQPFDRRFQSRMSSSTSNSPRASSPAFLNSRSHSRNASLSSNLFLDHAEADTSSPPWDVVRWTRLKKMNGQAFSESGRRNFGSPTCLAVSASIVLGTSKGIILMFDFNQNLKLIIGPGTKG